MPKPAKRKRRKPLIKYQIVPLPPVLCNSGRFRLKIVTLAFSQSTGATETSVSSTTILYDTQTLNDANQWAYTWSNVPRSDKTNDYSYYIQEKAVDGYDPSYYTDKIQLLLTKCVVDVPVFRFVCIL